MRGSRWATPTAAAHSSSPCGWSPAHRARQQLGGPVSAAVALRLLAGTGRVGAGSSLVAGRRAQGAITGALCGNRRTFPAGSWHRSRRTRPVSLPCRPGRREPLRAQFGRRLPGQGGDPAAHPGQGRLERLGLQGGPLVLRHCLATRALLDHTGTSAPAVLADVLVTRAPDPAFEVDRRVL